MRIQEIYRPAFWVLLLGSVTLLGSANQVDRNRLQTIECTRSILQHAAKAPHADVVIGNKSSVDNEFETVYIEEKEEDDERESFKKSVDSGNHSDFLFLNHLHDFSSSPSVHLLPSTKNLHYSFSSLRHIVLRVFRI